MLASFYNEAMNRIEIPVGHQSSVVWFERSPISSHHKIGLFCPSTAHEDIGFTLRFLQHLRQDLRAILIKNASFAWQDLIPLLNHVDFCQVVESMVTDRIPDELHYEGLLYSVDYSRRLVVQGEEKFSVQGNKICFLAASESAPSRGPPAEEQNSG